MFGMLRSTSPANSIVTNDWSAVAESPAARYQRKKRTRPIASSTLLPKIQRKSMLPPMWIQLPCMNIDVNAPSYQGRWWSAAPSTHGPETEHT